MFLLSVNFSSYVKYLNVNIVFKIEMCSSFKIMIVLK